MRARCVLVVSALLGCVSAQGGGCPSLVGPVVGSIFGTLAFVGIILGIVALVYYKRKQKDKEKLKKAQLEVGHENPTFIGDAEKGGSTSSQPPSSLTPQAKLQGGFTGYVECKEYESPTKKKGTISGNQNGSGPVRSLFLEESIVEAANKGQVVRKSGSSGSLDNSYQATEPNMVVVPLLSQDIMGLGFNVDGNLKEGIFVSKIHKRGPAHEAGLISLGDRILSVTVSFENMVLEDAMTILSYASPYPVKLCLRKPSTTTALVEAPDVQLSPSVVEDKDNINHPVYRSQSLDDLRQIGKEGLLHPRRTWSEMKKSGYVANKAVMEESNLKKWKGQPDMVQEDSSEPGDLNTHSTASNISIPDMKIDMGDLRMEPDDFVSSSVLVRSDADRSSVSSKEDTSGGVKVLSKSDLNMSVDSLNLEQDGIKKEITTSVHAMPELQEDGQVGEPVVTMTTTSVSFSGISEDSNKRPHDPDNAESKKIKIEDGSVSQDDILLNLGGSLSGPPPTEKPPSLPGAENSDDEPAEDGSDKVDGEEPTVRDVIRDYFGDNPNILQQFGLPQDAKVSRTVDVTTDGSTITRTEQLESEDGIRTTTTVESHSEIVAGSPDSGFMGTRPSLEISGVELKHSLSSSPSSSASSRSTSPTRRVDEGVEIKVTQAKEPKISPVIGKKSTGGLSFDITSDQNDNEANTPKDKSAEGPRAGVAYYYSIDQHGSPAHSVRPLGTRNYTREELGQPALIRPNPEHVISTTSVSNYDSDPSSTRTTVTHTERSASSDTAHTKDVNDNSQDLSDIKKPGKLTVTLSGSSTDDGIVLSPKDSSSNSIFDKESVTIIKQTDVVEAYTVTVNPEDSVA